MTAAWSLPFDVPESVLQRAIDIQAAAFNVDGVLTDGSLTLDQSGNEQRSFNVLDDHGLELLNAAGIEVGIICTHSSPALEARTQELGIKHFYADEDNKLSAFKQIARATNLNANQISYAGFDIVDVPIMLCCGLAFAVNNANHVTKKVAHWTTPNCGGAGAARQICELILFAQERYDDVIERYLHFDSTMTDSTIS